MHKHYKTIYKAIEKLKITEHESAACYNKTHDGNVLPSLQVCNIF